MKFLVARLQNIEKLKGHFISFSLVHLPQEEVAKNLLAEFNLGCDAHVTDHVYRVYVSTFLGFGGNAARQRYEENLIRKTAARNK